MTTALRATETHADMALPDAAVATKTAAEENFPVGSWLLPARLRAHVAVYYAFARTADDIADDPARDAVAKIVALDSLEAALGGSRPRDAAASTAARLRSSLKATGVPMRDAADLLVAFRQDAWKRRYRSWRELLDYCANSANPVGRYLLDLHGEGAECHPPSDALCTALQILNHLQDCGEDYRHLDRVYLPLDWLHEAGAEPGDLGGRAADARVRGVLDRTLDGVDDLNRQASDLPGRIANRRMRLEAAVVVAIAERLTARLRKEDPLARRVVLTRRDKALCLLEGIRRGW